MQISCYVVCIRAHKLFQGREDSLQHRENEGGLSMQQKQFIRVEMVKKVVVEVSMSRDLLYSYF